MSGVGKTTAGRAVARRYDLWFYSLDSRTFAHDARMPRDDRMPDELWVERSPQQMADQFEAYALLRFPLVLEELAAIPDDGAPILVEGPHLLPGLVSGPALFVIASPGLQRRLLERRGSFTYSTTRDPVRAFENRARRDVLLAERLRPYAVEIGRVEETEPLVEEFVDGNARDWVSRPDRGDVAARRRAENECRVDQWRRYAEREPRACEGTIELACECDRPACAETVRVSLPDALVAVESTRPILS